jgi:hypothetical protein
MIGRLSGENTEDLAALQTAVARVAEPTVAVLPLQQSTAGGSGSFLVSEDDGRKYWCKCLQNPQSPRVPINEQLVGRIGQLIGAAVCDVTLIKIPAELEHWEFLSTWRIGGSNPRPSACKSLGSRPI